MTALSCQAFTYEENNHPICSLHDKLLEIDHHHPVSKPTAKYFQRVSFKSCHFLSLHTRTCSSSIYLDLKSKRSVNFWTKYCRTRNFRVCLYIAYLACGSASLYIKTLYFFITVLALTAAAIFANIKIRYDAKLPNSLYLGHA